MRTGVARLRAGLLVGTIAVLSGCATEVFREPTSFRPATGEKEPILVLARDIDVASSAGYSRTLKAGSSLKYRGRVPQGKVYSLQGDVLVLEGKHMHEAYLVVTDGTKLVGFYLPVEQAFSPLSPPIALPLKQ